MDLMIETLAKSLGPDQARLPRGTLPEIVAKHRPRPNTLDLPYGACAQPGQMPALLANWLGQPLAAILRNAQAGLSLLASGNAVTDATSAILQDVVADARRAGSVIDSLQSMLRSEREVIYARISTLSFRERETLEHVVRGRRNKQIADDMSISVRTVKVHRARAMVKMKVRSVAELVHLCGLVGIQPDISFALNP